MSKKLVCLVVLVLATAPLGTLRGAAISDRWESFDADPGWKGSGNQGGGNRYGYLPGPSSYARGDNPGELGGTMVRSGAATYYADTNLQGSFDTSVVLKMSGRIAVTKPIGDPGSDRNVFGYLNTNSSAPTMLGIRICDRRNTRANWRIRLCSINSAGSAQGSDAASGVEMTNEGDYSFEWTYDPGLGANGRLTLHITTETGSIWVGENDTVASQEETITLDLAAGHGKADSAARFNAFGLAVMNTASNGQTADVYLDDLRYNFLEPGKASNPNPPDGALQTAPWVVLSWKTDPLAILYDVYLGDNFEDVKNGTGNTFRGRQTVPMYPVGLAGSAYPEGLVPGTTYYWRIDGINEANPNSPWKGNVWSFLVPPYTAYAPAPEHGATTVRPRTTLTWQSGLSATRHHLYLGQDLDLVRAGAATVDKGILETTTFDPNGLLEGTTYYWRVDEIDALGAVTGGPVWTFATMVPIDEFESYTDDLDAGGAIFQTWIDGWENKTGSVVGYLAAPFAERRIVHGGRQAMPLEYNNVSSPWYSEAERTFAPAGHWTLGGTSMLVLQIRGRRANDRAPLYVAIADSANRRATAVHPDTAIVRSGNWVQWQIPFTVFTNAGVNLAAVRKMAIGVGDPDKPVPGAKGLLYIDDIARALAPATK